MTAEKQQASDFAMRMEFALRKDPDDAVRRTHVTLRVVLATMAWLVVVPILVVFGFTGPQRGDTVFTVAAVLNLVFPFTAAVIATQAKRSGVAGIYIVLTLLMILPSLAIFHAG